MAVVDDIEQRLASKGRLFVTKTDFMTSILGAKIRQRLGITPQSTAETLARVLANECSDRLRLMRGGRSLYVVRALPDEAFLLDKAQRLTQFTANQLSTGLPLTQERFHQAFTQLLLQQQLVCIALKMRWIPVFRLATAITTAASVAPSVTDDRQLFHQAYLQIGRGRSFVPIHQLRSNLGWDKTRFDDLVRQLHAEESILLNMGDPTQLTSEEIGCSFQDDNGMLYLTLNWLDGSS
ncbi:MAG: hypothetical protein HQL58_03960 [Magnetococcales bacterium]|nr:hypothetical protein [Magnetococcales bacterium]